MSKQRHPEEDVLSADEHKIVEGGREALRSLGRRTFDHWMAVGRGIKVLRAKADRLGGTKTFRRLLARHGFDSLDNSVISKLLKPSPRRRGLARNSLR
jgi:hypothetical protein